MQTNDFMLSTGKTLAQGSTNFSLEVPIVNILGSVSHMVSVAATQLCHCSVKASTENTFLRK